MLGYAVVATDYAGLGDLRDVLTDKALAIYDSSVEDGCSAASGAFAALPIGEMLKAGWNENQYVQEFLARNQPGEQSTYEPLLLVSGGDDVLFTNPQRERLFSASTPLAYRRSVRSTLVWGIIRLYVAP